MTELRARGTDVGELRARLRAYVAHESESSRRALEETWALPVAERVDSGDCVSRLRVVGQNGNGTIMLQCEDFVAKFRDGDPLFLGSGEDVERGYAVNFVGYDVARGRVRVALDRFETQDVVQLDPDGEYCLDRRGLGLERLLLEGLDAAFHPENAHCIDMLLGRTKLAVDRSRYDEGVARGAEVGFTPSQQEALGRIAGNEGLCLIQGPPGTGKTRLLAEAALLLAKKGCRLFVTGFTHRAVNNVLLALRGLHPDVPIYKVGGGRQNEGLDRAGVVRARAIDAVALPKGGAVVGGTPYVARQFCAERRFHFVLMDEAGQMPVVHGAIALTQARRCVVVGDPRQLPPVRQGRRADALLGGSVYEYLERHQEGLMLDRTFRMNAELTELPSREFYDERLRAAAPVARARLRLRPGGRLREVLDPARPLVWARIDHEGRTRRSPEEVRLVVDLVEEVLRTHGIAPAEVAVIAPFRAQVRLLRHELERRRLFHPDLVVDTVERMQGQEREVVVISLVASDRDYLAAQAEFYFEPGRLNVALTRARTKCIVVASRHAFRARPVDLDRLLDAAVFKRLARSMPAVNLTAVYREPASNRATTAADDAGSRDAPGA